MAENRFRVTNIGIPINLEHGSPNRNVQNQEDFLAKNPHKSLATQTSLDITREHLGKLKIRKDGSNDELART